MRICFIGSAGSGKSTLAAQVYSGLKSSGRSVDHVHEWIRNDINAHGPMTSIWEQYRTRQHQKELEDAVPDKADFIICDSGTLTPYFYAALHSNPANPRERLVLQDMYKYMINDLFLRRYDMVFYLPLLGYPNFDDGTRYQSREQIAVVDQHMRLVFTQLHRLPNVHVVESRFEQRLDDVMWKLLGEDKLTLLRQTDTFVNSTSLEVDQILQGG